MQARRSFAHGPDGGWSAIALHLETAESGKEGFYLTLFPDGRPQSVVFLLPNQMGKLLDLAAQSTVTDAQLWEYVAKIPLEPLLPSRTLATRMRAMLVDFGGQIREELRKQAERRPPLPPAEPSENGDLSDDSEDLSPEIETVDGAPPGGDMPIEEPTDPHVTLPPKPPW